MNNENKEAIFTAIWISQSHCLSRISGNKSDIMGTIKFFFNSKYVYLVSTEQLSYMKSMLKW